MNLNWFSPHLCVDVILIICTVQTQTASTKPASLPPLPALCIRSLWSTSGQLKVNDHIGKHYKWPTTSKLYQKLFKCGVYFLNSGKKAIKSCSSCLVYSSWFQENMGFLFWRSIQTTQNIIGFGLTDLPHKELKQKNKKINYDRKGNKLQHPEVVHE